MCKRIADTWQLDFEVRDLAIKRLRSSKPNKFEVLKNFAVRVFASFLGENVCELIGCICAIILTYGYLLK
jgi:hypothetical protein